MKKILLMSSALVLVGGAAFAEVSLSGAAEMGIVGGDASTDTAETEFKDQFWTDIEVDFALSGETDGGVTFGAEIGLEEADGGIANTSEDDFTVFVSGDFGTITMGDTDGAFDWAMQDTNYGMAGTINDNEEHLGFDGMNLLDGIYDGQIARYDYSFGAFAFAVSVELDDDRDTGDAGGAKYDIDEPMLGVGAKYKFDLSGGSVGIGAAYQGAEDIYLAGAAVTAAFGGFEGMLAYYDGEVVGLGLGLNGDLTNIELEAGEAGDVLLDISYLGVSGGYTIDAFTIGVNYGQYDIETVDDAWGAGITAAYDLGGGLELQAGYGYSEVEDAGEKVDASTYSFGVAMSF